MTEIAVAYDVARGTAYLTSQQIIIYATSFVYYVILFRILNLSEIGQISLLAVAMAIFGTLTQMALPIAATRFIASNIGIGDFSKAGAVAKTCLHLLVTLAAPALLLAILLSPWIGSLVFESSNASSLLIATFSAAFLLDLTALYGAYFLGMGLYAEVVYQNVLYVPVSRGLGLTLAYLGMGVLGIPAGWTLGAFGTFLVSLYLWRGKLLPGSSYPVRSLLAFSLPVFASALIALLQGWGDITLLQALVGQLQTTGAYYLIVSSVAFLSILWSPLVGALYPALSSTHSSGGSKAVSDRLAVTFRLVNITVLPVSASLAAVASTALQVVYGQSLAAETFAFALLTITVVVSAQGALLITTLQAIGSTKPLLKIFLTATIFDLGAVALTAKTLGTTAGAIGRTLLAVSILLLAWQSLRPVLKVPLGRGMSKAIPLAVATSIPLALTDQFLTHVLLIPPILRLPVILVVFTSSFLIVSRKLFIFQDEDFAILKSAVPRPVHPYLRIIQRLFIQTARPLPQHSSHSTL